MLRQSSSKTALEAAQRQLTAVVPIKSASLPHQEIWRPTPTSKYGIGLTPFDPSICRFNQWNPAEARLHLRCSGHGSFSYIYKALAQY